MLYGRKSTFCIEGGTEFVGYTTGEKWKVYESPYFEKEIVEQIFKNFDFLNWGYNSDKDCFIYYCPEERLESNKDIPVLYGVDIRTIEGFKHVYQLGAGEWIWQECSSFENYIVVAYTSHFIGHLYNTLTTKDWKEVCDWIKLYNHDDKCLMITVHSKNKDEDATLLKTIKKKPKNTKTKQYYSFHTMFRSVKNLLSDFCKESNIYYELSGGMADWHFEVYCSEDELKKCNDFLKSISITEE